MRLLLAAAALACFSLADAAGAADLTVLVRTTTGAPVANAVVTVYPATGGHEPPPPGQPLVLAQKDIAFSPYVLVAPVGSTIAFPNRDTVRHHVYSFSPAHRFEMKLYGREDHRFEHFDKVGVVAVGCNIHDSMAAYIDVVDTRYADKTDAQGRVVIAGLPDGAATLKVWHPNGKAPGGLFTKTLTVAGASPQTAMDIDLRAPAAGKQDH